MTSNLLDKTNFTVLCENSLLFCYFKITVHNHNIYFHKNHVLTENPVLVILGATMYRTWEITWKIFSHNCPNKIIGSRFTFSWERLCMKIMVTMVWIMSNGFFFRPGPNMSAKLQKLLLKSYTICAIINEIAFLLASTFLSSFHFSLITCSIIAEFILMINFDWIATISFI